MKPFKPCAVAALLACAACGSRDAPRTESQPPDTQPVHRTGEPPTRPIQAWDCDDGSYLVSHYRTDKDDLALFLPDRTVFLRPLRAASGARFGDGTVSLWVKGERASVDTGAGTPRVCSENRRASVFESAKLRGNDFWATGNEPGWTLEIGPEQMTWITNYGADRHTLTTPEPETDQDNAVTTYRTHLDGAPFTVTLSLGPCRDSMADESFETRVEVRFGGAAYAGCGRPLH